MKLYRFLKERQICVYRREIGVCRKEIGVCRREIGVYRRERCYKKERRVSVF